jgi:hypothetical protein
MVTSKVFGAPATRPLFIDFDAYTDGDEHFKKELVMLMIDNLLELQQTVQIVSMNNDAQRFHKTCHKIKATLEMLEDTELMDTIIQLKIMITDASRIALLERLCTDIIESLRREN